MPNTINYRPALINTLISTDRIGSYVRVFNPVTDIELMGVYLWNAHVCAAIYPLLLSAEITLRNSIDQALVAHLGKFWWAKNKLKYKSYIHGIAPPKIVDSIKSNFDKATKVYVGEKKARYHITGKVIPQHESIVAKTDFSTWEYLLDHEFMAPGLIWQSQLGTVLTGPWPSTQAATTLTHAKDLVSTVRLFRNRVFHYEPAWKGYGVLTEQDAITHLHEKIKKIEALITLVSPEKLRLLQVNGIIDAAYRAASSHEIKRFQHLASSYKVDSLRKLKMVADSGKNGNKILKVQVSSGGQQSFFMVPIMS